MTVKSQDSVDNYFWCQPEICGELLFLESLPPQISATTSTKVVSWNHFLHSLSTFTDRVISDFSLKTMTTITATLSSTVFACANAACRPLYYSRHTQFTQQENTILGPNSIELGRNHKLIELRWRWRIRQLNQPSSQPVSCQPASVWGWHTHILTPCCTQHYLQRAFTQHTQSLSLENRHIVMKNWKVTIWIEHSSSSSGFTWQTWM